MITVRDIVAATGDHYGLTPREMFSQRRHKGVVRARQVATWIARRCTDYTLSQIGAALGGRDHTTVLHSIRRIETEIGADAGLAADIAAIVEALDIAQDALGRLGISRPAPDARDIADEVLADPARRAVQVSTDGILLMALAVRHHEAARMEAGETAQLRRVAAAARELFAAAAAARTYDDAARAAARERQAAALAALRSALAALDARGKDDEEDNGDGETED